MSYSFIKRKNRFRRFLLWLLKGYHVVIILLLIYICYLFNVISNQDVIISNHDFEKSKLLTLIDNKTIEVNNLNNDIVKLNSIINPTLPEKIEPVVLPVNTNELLLLAKTIYFESASESKVGKIAIASVVLNRMKEYSMSLKDVISQPDQFSYYGKKFTISDSKTFEECRKIAELMLTGYYKDITGGATYYHSKKVKPTWAKEKIMVATIDRHIFYRD